VTRCPSPTRAPPRPDPAGASPPSPASIAGSSLAAVATAVTMCCWSGRWRGPRGPAPGAVQRIFYIHVPAAWIGMLAFAGGLRRQHRLPGHPVAPLGPAGGLLGRGRRRVHDRRDADRPAVGPAGVGRVLGLGPAPDQLTSCCGCCTSPTWCCAATSSSRPVGRATRRCSASSPSSTSRWCTCPCAGGGPCTPARWSPTPRARSSPARCWRSCSSASSPSPCSTCCCCGCAWTTPP
jgi:hypothetical protein